jgi:magnesium-transporting ATPase (P-type)
MEEEIIKLSKKSVKHEFETEEVQDENKKTFNWAEFLACVSVATTNLHTGFALGFSAILLPQLEKYTDEMGELSKSQSSWIDVLMFACSQQHFNSSSIWMSIYSFYIGQNWSYIHI